MRGLLLILTLLSTLGASTLLLQPAFVPSASAATAEDEYFELMKLFVDTFEQIDRNYVKPVDRRELMEAAMRGMVLKLDPYSSYIDTSDLKQFNESVEQEFGGIGIQVMVEERTRRLMVMIPIPGTPAYKAGLRAGDHIIEIDDKPTADFVEGREMQSAVKLMRGKPGDSVKLKIQHKDDAEPITLDVTRAIIKTPTVLGDHYDKDGNWSYFLEGEDKIGYLRLTSFGRNSTEEIHDSLEKLKKDGMKALILDLRFNPGGLLSAATAISDFFVESGVIVSTKGRNTDEQTYKAKKAGTFSGFPMVVLVNRYSASASEIVSACLQDHKRAIVVGERTWGKGSVQNVIELEGGKSALKLTTASYHRPSGKNIHRFPKATEKDEWGVMPDEGFEVKFTDEEMRKLDDVLRVRGTFRSDGTAPKVEFVDSQLAKGSNWLKEQLAAKKSDADKPADAEKPAGADEKNKAAGKPAEKKEGARLQKLPGPQYVEAILEWLQLFPHQNSRAA
ncbi:MAG: S41 family peptidase [Planctomycetota bacterium]